MPYRAGEWLQAAVCAIVACCVALAATAALWVVVPAVAFGWRPMAVESGSMAPAVLRGHLLLASPFDGEQLPAGTVITFSDPASPGELVTHRIESRLPGGSYRTRGDANPQPDTRPVPPASIEHLGRLVIPFAGWPTLWLRERPLLPLAVVALTFLVVWSVSAVGAGTRRQVEVVPPPIGASGVWHARQRPDASSGEAATSPTGQPPGRPGTGRAARGRRRSSMISDGQPRILKTMLHAGAIVALAAAGMGAAGFTGTSGNFSSTWAAASLDAPASLTATDGCSGSSPVVSLSWSAANSPATDGYEILRRESTSDPYATLATVAGPDTTSYTDASVAAGATYYYVVLATGSTWRSQASPEATATTALVCGV